MLDVDVRGCRGVEENGKRERDVSLSWRRKEKDAHIPRRELVFFVLILRMVDFVVIVYCS